MAGLGTLASGIKPIADRRRSDVYLVELNEKDEVATLNDGILINSRRFQYFPESISDTKQINYATKDIPGASLPLYQWVSSGARTIGFTATFTTDVDLIGESEDASGALDSITERLASSGVQGDNVYIPGAIAWLRRFMLPRYAVEESGTGVPIIKPPRKVLLVMPELAQADRYGGSKEGNPGFSDFAQGIPCIMLTCDVTLDAFFPNGLPRIASVQLSFAEVAQLGGAIQFPQAESETDSRQGSYTYKLEHRHREVSSNLLDDIGL